MQQHNAQQRLDDALAKLPTEKQPERDLWKGIELGLEQPVMDIPARTNRKPVWLASAASFALLAMIGWFGLGGGSQGQADLSAQSAALVQSLTQQHQTQVNALLVKFEGQTAVTENWQQQLQELDEAAVAIKAALAQDPANTALLQMLHHVYQQQIALIERVHAPKWQQI